MNIKKNTFLLAACFVFTIARAQVSKAPAYPLITHTPYFSLWSFSDTLNAATTTHWTGANQSVIGMLKVDGVFFRFMGREPESYKTVLPTSEESNYEIRYTETKPANEWTQLSFDDRQWNTGKAPVGNLEGNNTIWATHDIWIRRRFVVKNKEQIKNLLLRLTHDDGAEVFLNGEQIYKRIGPVSYRLIDVAQSRLKEGENILTMHVENTGGSARADAGLLERIPPVDFPPAVKAVQTNRNVSATQTAYKFKCGGVDLELVFTSPLLMNDLTLLSRPVSYITCKVSANDGKPHQAEAFVSISTDVAVNHPSQPVTATQYVSSGLAIVKAGTVEQPVLKKKGDDLRIDWGYMYAAVPVSSGVKEFITPERDAVGAFYSGKYRSTQAMGTGLALNIVIPMGSVGENPVTRFMELGYDEVYPIQYFHQNLRPYWNSTGNMNFEEQLKYAADSYLQTCRQCDEFDHSLYETATRSGGEAYAALCVMAYRQSIAAHQLVKSPKGELLWLSKENFSNGSINTVDVTYPSAPLYLLYNPHLLEGMLNGIFEYSESGRFAKDFPAHDLGKYPVANGQLYGEDMPVEEAGNMIILVDAISRIAQNSTYAKAHWKVLSTWVKYLEAYGLDPDNQLTTDDFAGHLARNANLSVKAIVAIGCYADLARQLGEVNIADEYRQKAEQMVSQWIKLADAGDHFSLAFGHQDTWSQKYNLVWDKVLQLNLFPQSVYDKEMNFYLTRQQTFGLPLDSRKTYTKSDWITWTATMSSTRKDFDALIHPLYKFANETPSRVPFSDWYETTDGKMRSFQARSVVGGYFIKILKDSLNR